MLDDPAHLVQLRLERRLPGRECGRDRCNLDARAFDARDRRGNEVRVDADRGDGRNVGIGGIRPDRLRRQRRDLPWCVLALERREIHHPHRELEREHLGLALDRAFRERGCALFERDRVDGADSR